MRNEIEFIRVAFDTTLVMENINFKDSDISLFSVISSRGEIKNINFTNINNVQFFTKLLDSYSVILDNIFSLNSSANSEALIHIESCHDISLLNLGFSDINQLLLKIDKSNITEFNNMTLFN